jgi:hypothetical protein
MKRAIKNIILKSFIALMALQILNMSVDAIEFHPLITSAANDIGDFNDINSATEFISEILLGHKDAFPEFDKKADSKQSQCFKHIDMKKFPPGAAFIDPRCFEEISGFSSPLDEQYFFLFLKEINPPPPKSC